MDKILKISTALICITSLSGCAMTPIEMDYKQPKEGSPRAKILVNEADVIYQPKLIYYLDGSNCSGKRTIDASNDNKEFYIDAPFEATMALSMHMITGTMNFQVHHSCEVPFSFFPKPDHVYSLRLKVSDHKCGVRLTDLSGEYVAVTYRERQTLLPAATGWCK